MPKAIQGKLALIDLLEQKKRKKQKNLMLIDFSKVNRVSPISLREAILRRYHIELPRANYANEAGIEVENSYSGNAVEWE